MNKQNKQREQQELDSTDLPLSPVIKKGKTKLTYYQSEFNRLNKKIANLKNEIALIPTKEQKIRVFYKEKAKPLYDKEVELKYDYLIYLDNVYEKEKLTKTNKETLADLILDEGEGVAESIEQEEKRAEVIRIMKKYEEIVSGLTREELELRAVEDSLSFMQFVMGIKPTEAMKNAKTEQELNDALLDYLESEMSKRQAKEESKKEQKLFEGQETETTKGRKKVSRAEMKQKLQEEQTLKSMREIYLELVKELHPDREMDESARALKEEKMKQLTEAYQQKDLASLLMMQVNWLQEESANTPQSHTDEVLKKFNKVLRSQLKKLEEEFYLLCNAPLAGVHEAYARLRHVRLEMLDYYLNNFMVEQKEVLETVVEYKKSVSTLEGLKKFLRKYRKRQKEDDLYDEFEFPF